LGFFFFYIYICYYYTTFKYILLFDIDMKYRKEEIYTMEWEGINLSRYRIAGAPYGGPIGKYINIIHY